MNNIKNNLKSGFTVIPNKLIRDKEISDRARLLFIYMASQSNDWKFYNYGLAKAMGYSIETLRKYLNELVYSGWITKIEQERKGGQFGANCYIINEQPIQVSPCRENTDTVKNGHGKSPTHKNKKPNRIKNDSDKNPLIEETKKSNFSRGQPLE
ncbi:helix-turn-helix domain-containing protein [Galbibacter mesophilus]|uniref:helix-turn-helix domain-containing protein n=1 Tax=Galbibacter mesophilus TaxID=379069 RepID=UPI00191D47E7|nr:helix-turn-helix domain-containing protein [Galbibacter mesophilus]MCM5664278.1 helix-turn-helix domain-containing protein [Galbibacter mesophilus]